MPEIREYTPARSHSLDAVPRVRRPGRRDRSGTSRCSTRWRCSVTRSSCPTARIGHAELRVGDTRVHAGRRVPRGEPPEPDDARRRAPSALDAPRSRADATVLPRGRRAGAEALRPDRRRVTAPVAARSFDPFGHRWFIADRTSRAEDLPVRGQSPAAATATSGTSTLQRARRRACRARFYGALFGLAHRRRPRAAARSTSRRSRRPRASTGGDRRHPSVRLYFRVDDIEAAAEHGARARRAGALGRRLRVRRQRRVHRRPGPPLRPFRLRPG